MGKQKKFHRRKRTRTHRDVTTRIVSKQSNAEPRVGIFWLVDDQLLIHMTRLSRAERYGNCLTYPGSHIDVWRRYHHSGKIPRDIEYEELPRGRVVYETGTQQFTVLADQCILKRKAWIERIKKTLRLPKDLTVRTDPHYQCFRCLGRTVDR